MIIKFLESAYKARRFVFGTTKTIHAKRNDAKKLEILPMAQLVTLLMTRLNCSVAGWKGQLRLPAVWFATEVKLPLGLEEFYDVCDDAEAVNGDFSLQILPRAQLKLGENFDRPPSATMRKHWLKYGRTSDEQEAMPIFPANDLLPLLADQEELVLPFSALKQCVPLGTLGAGIYPLLIVSPLVGMLAGSMLKVEG